MSEQPTFTFDGSAVPFRAGQSVGAALWAAGQRELRRTTSGDPRGMFCAIGVCHECHVVIDGRADQRACLTEARPGLRVESQTGHQLPVRPAASAVVAAEEVEADVIVIGAGPAGLAAAVAAAEEGARVALVDAEQRVGGQYWRHGMGGVGARHHDVAHWQRLDRAVAEFVAEEKINVLLAHRVWRLESSSHAVGAGSFVGHAAAAVNSAHPDDAERRVRLRAAAVVVATGAFDRVFPFPGWDLPGVLTAGAAQAMLKQHEVLPGRRVVVAGTGPFLISLAAELSAAGAEVAELLEAGDGRSWLRNWRVALSNPDAAVLLAGWVRTLARRRVPVRPRHVVVAAHGRDRLEAVIVSRVNSAGTVIPGTSRWVPCDTLAVGWGFTPRLDLARQLGARASTHPQTGMISIAADAEGRVGLPGLFVAGEVRGVGGAQHALVTGAAAGAAAAAWARGIQTTPTGSYLTQLRQLTNYARAIQQAQRVSPAWVGRVTPATVVCRCESVTAASLSQGVQQLGADDLRSAKLLSRCGMGWCQGRVCGEGVEQLVAAGTGQPVTGLPDTRPVSEPVTLAALLTTAEDLLGPDETD